MKRFATYVAGILALTFFLSSVLPAEENLPLEEFMQRVRNPRVFASYAALEGTVQHQRSGEARRSVPIYFAVVLLPERMTGQIILDNAEGYLLGQTRQGGSSETSVLPMQGNLPDANLLGWMGIHPSDLTMSFLYYPVIRELEPETIRTVGCRVVELKGEGDETVRVYIARDYYFPLRAEFYKPSDDNGEVECYRTLEVNSFRKMNDLYYTDRIGLYGPGWRTRIDFDSDSACVDRYDSENPPAIIRPLKTAPQPGDGRTE